MINKKSYYLHKQPLFRYSLCVDVLDRDHASKQNNQYICFKSTCRGARVMIVIVVGNAHSNPSSNPGEVIRISNSTNTLGVEIN